MIDPTKPLSVEEPEKQRDNSNKPWLFQPGQSGNPKGRPPKHYSITDAFKEMLGASKEKKETIVNKIYEAAASGDMVAAKMIWQYMDGMPLQSTDITSMGEKLEAPHVIVDTKRRTTVKSEK